MATSLCLQSKITFDCLFAFLDQVAFSKWTLLLKEANSFLQKLNPISSGQNVNERIAFPLRVLIYFMHSPKGW